MEEVLIVVQNLSVPRDRRVWAESMALKGSGHRVRVICPRGSDEPSHEEIDGVEIHRYAPPPQTSGVLSFVIEFVYCWVRTLHLAVRLYRDRPFDVIQACNPPDTYFALAWRFRHRGVRFVFDQHDLCPELYISRFERPSPLLHRALLALERLTYRTADHVISTNESYRETAIRRGHLAGTQVTVVRNGPDTQRMCRGAARPELRRGRAHLCCWVGVMGPQDGLDVLVESIEHYVHHMGRSDCTFALLGTGDAFDDVARMVEARGLGEFVQMPGWTFDGDLRAYLSTADIGLCADPPSPFNDVSTMNKTMEYMAFALPMVAFDLQETRVSAGVSACYVEGGDATGFARAIAALLDDPDRRACMGRSGRERAVQQLDWLHQVPAYLAVYDGLAGPSLPQPAPATA